MQDFVHFTYEDLYFYVPSPNHIRCLVEKHWKYAVYYDIYTGRAPEYEMYDLDRDPNESLNLVDRNTGEVLSSRDAALRSELGQRLDRLMAVNGTAPG